MPDVAELTLAQLEAVVRERRATTVAPGCDGRCRRNANRPARADLEAVLKGGQRLTVIQIAHRLGTTTRDVQQVVCNVIYTGSPWLGRERIEGGRYRYFLTGR